MKARCLLNPGLEILLCHFLASHGLLICWVFVTVAEFSGYLEERLHCKFLTRLNQSETLFQPPSSEKRKGLVDSLGGFSPL